jgi:hypothetical protein
MEENTELKYFFILATFNDSTFVRANVTAVNYTQANKAFFELPTMVEAQQVPNRKLMQVTLCERETPPVVQEA